MEILLGSPNVIHITPFYKWNLIEADPDDNKFVDCALNAGAEYIVTNDKHFDALRRVEFPPVRVVNMAGFKNLLFSD
jgi:predicted nucleic acid-binding protein